MRELAAINVCFVAGTLGQGGSERQLYYMLAALREAGARPELLCLTRGEFWEDRIRALGVPIAWVGQHASRLARLTRIIRALRIRRPDVLQSQHFYTNLYAAAAARLLRFREIGALRSDPMTDVRENGAVLGRLSLIAPRTIVANSGIAVRRAVELGVPPGRLHMLPNVVDLAQFGPAPHEKSGVVTLLAVGRLGPEKRFDRLLFVLAALRESCSTPFRALIVGDGPERHTLERQAFDLGLLHAVVEFRGPVAAVGPVYRESDVLVLTSDWEGTPNVILEAMASGLTIVSTRVGGVPEIVTHGETGYLVDRDDTRALRQALERLVDNRSLRLEMGQRAREYVLAQHSLQQLPHRLTTLYHSVLS